MTPPCRHAALAYRRGAGLRAVAPGRAFAVRVAVLLVTISLALGGAHALEPLAEGSPAPAQLVVATEHVRLVFDDPALEPFARQAAALAEEAVVRVAELFGTQPFPITVALSDRTDAFNAVATPMPRPTIALRAIPPVGLDLGFGAESWLRLVVLHEVAHLVHFSGLDRPNTGLGFVGDGVSPPPPLWLVEGLATWVESELTRGGRRDDARTAGVLATLALDPSRSSRWPSLGAASTGTHERWPGNATRYLLGVGFLQELITTHGWTAVVAAIEAYNRAPLWQPFASAWHETVGSDLFAEWGAWQAELAAAAEVRQAHLPDAPLTFTDTGWQTGLPSLAPSGRRVAWRTWPAAVAVAELGALERAADEGQPVDPARYLVGTFVESLDWLDEHTLVYTRPAIGAATVFSDVFTLDLRTGRESRWTTGGRAHFARAESGGTCVRYVRAGRGKAPAVMRVCRRRAPTEANRPTEAGTPREVWRAEVGQEIVGFDVARDGPMVLSLWEAGRVGLAVLEDDGRDALRARLLTWDRFLDLDPVWTPSGTIRFRSDRTERFEVWEVDPGQATAAGTRLTQWTATLGGAFAPAAERLMVVLGADGYDLAQVPLTPHATVVATLDARVAGRVQPRMAPPAEPYDPWSTLAPFGWLPTRAFVQVGPRRAGLEVEVYGLDASAAHAWTATVGVDTALAGPLGPAYASVRYTHGPSDPFASHVGTPARTAFAAVGAWPHAAHLTPTTETAVGARLGATTRTRGTGWAAAASLQVGLVHLASVGGIRPEGRLDAFWTTAGSDRWGYSRSGARFAAHAVTSPTREGASAGAWLAGSLRRPALGGSINGAFQVGYRPPPPVPLDLAPWALTVAASGRWHVPLAWRVGDGRYAVERLTVEPALRAWADTGSDANGGLQAGAALGVGGDVAIGADLLVNYVAPVTVRVRGGWSGSWWADVGVGLPF